MAKSAMRKNSLVRSSKVFSGDDEGRYLLLKCAKTKKLELPGGKLDEGESYKHAGKREYKEETGKKIKNLILIFKHSSKNKKHHLFGAYKENLKPKKKLSHEHTGYKRLTLKEMRSKKYWNKLSPRTQKFLNKTSDKQIKKAVLKSKKQQETLKPALA